MFRFPRHLVAAAAVAMLAAGAQAADMSSGDKSFMTTAAHNGHEEVEASKLAQQKSSNPQVKSFADQMVQDHTKAGDELNSIAMSKGVKLPEGPSIAQKTKMSAMKLTSGATFDKRYVADALKGHEETVALFQKESTQGTDPELKAFASKTLPTLQQHLDMVKQLDTSMSGSPMAASSGAMK